VRALTRRRSPDLPARLEALAEIAELGDGRLPDDLVRDVRTIVDRAGERLRLSAHTVAALAGATGSGKSSLFNALAGTDLSPVGVRRPTTAHTVACVWDTDEDGAGPLLDWLEVGRRHHLDEPGDLEGLVLLDLVDHDSVERGHRLEVDRLVEQVDLLVWVLDPQKYADAAVHDRYLRPLAGHGDVITVVLNQIDRLDEAEVAVCTGHLERLLAADGLGKVAVLPISAVTGEGVDALRRLLADRVARGHARAERLAADVDGILGRLEGCVGSAGRRRPGGEDLVGAMQAAAGVPVVADAVARSYRMRAVAATGWPVTRWVRRLRPDPLRRLGIGREAAARTSLPAPTPVQRSQLDTAVRRVADAAADGLPAPWVESVRRAARSRQSDLADALDQAVATADVNARAPRWWRVLGFLQVLLLLAALTGLGWLALLAVLAYFRLPEPATPEVWQLPVPTVLALGGIALGLVVAGLGRLLAAIGGRRRRSRAATRMREQVVSVAERLVLEPVERELEAHALLGEKVQSASRR
jgi:GTP-binding protein EngB required for normal cell division